MIYLTDTVELGRKWNYSSENPVKLIFYPRCLLKYFMKLKMILSLLLVHDGRRSSKGDVDG